MIVTSMQLTISSRRDIAVLRKESSSREGEGDVNFETRGIARLRVLFLTKTRRGRGFERAGIRLVGGLYPDKGAATRGPVASLGHLESNVRAERIELFHDQIEAGVADRLHQVFALDPKGGAVVP